MNRNCTLLVVDNLFALGLTPSVVARALQQKSESTELHIVSLRGFQGKAWLSGVPIQVHELPATLTTQAAEQRLEYEGVDSLFSRQAMRLMYQVRKLICQLQPETIHMGGTWAAQLVGLATMGLAGTRQPTKLVYHERWLTKAAPWRLWRSLAWASSQNCEAQVTHELLRQSLIERSFPGAIEVEPLKNQHPFNLSSYFQMSERSTAGRYLRQRLGLSDVDKIAGTVAPLIPRSRLKDLIWATDQLNVVLSNFHLVIFGRGSQLQRLKQFARQTETANFVHFLGEPDDAWLLLQGLDAVWHSHLHEPYPQSLLLAMRVGIPCVSVLGPGTSELIMNQKTGLGVNFGARYEYARWTKYILEQTASADLIRQQAYQHLQKIFGSDMVNCKR